MLTMSILLSALPSLSSLLTLLLYIIVAAIFVWILRAALTALGVTVPQPIMVLIGLALFILILIWFFGGGRIG